MKLGGPYAVVLVNQLGCALSTCQQNFNRWETLGTREINCYLYKLSLWFVVVPVIRFSGATTRHWSQLLRFTPMAITQFTTDLYHCYYPYQFVHCSTDCFVETTDTLSPLFTSCSLIFHSKSLRVISQQVNGTIHVDS